MLHAFMPISLVPAFSIMPFLLFSLFFQTSGGAVGVFAFIVWQPKPSSLLYPIWWKIASQLLPSPDAIKAFSSVCNQIDSQHRKFKETMYNYTCTNLHRRNRNGLDISIDCADGFWDKRANQQQNLWQKLRTTKDTQNPWIDLVFVFLFYIIWQYLSFI